MAGRHGPWIGLAALALSAIGPAAAQDRLGGSEEERRGRIVEGAGPEFSRVDSIPLVIEGARYEVRAVALVTDKQVCAALTEGGVTRRDQSGDNVEGAYLSGFMQPRFGLETLDGSDRIGIGYVAGDTLVVDARRAKPGDAAQPIPTSQDIAAGIAATTNSCLGLSMVKQATGGSGQKPQAFPVAVAISLGDQPTLTIIEPNASYTIDREAFRRLDVAVGAGQGSAIPAYAMSLSWWGQ